MEQHGELIATNAYALMLSKSPFIFIELRCGCFKERGPKFIDQADLGCPIYKQVDDAYKFVLRNIRLGGTIRGVVRVNEYELPPDAIRELIINAVQHRNYVYDNRQIFVAVYEDRLEITSPGGIPSPLNANLMSQSRSVHRNPLIAKMFRAAGMTEGWGSGIKSVFDQCAEYGIPEPVIEDNGIDVRVTLYKRTEPAGGNGSNGAKILHRVMGQSNLREPNEPNREPNEPNREPNEPNREPNELNIGFVRDLNEPNRESVHDPYDDDIHHALKIINLIESDGKITIVAMSKEIKASESTVKRLMGTLKREGVLARSGSKRNGEWIVVSDCSPLLRRIVNKTE